MANMAQPDPYPLPPDDLPLRTLPIDTIPEGESLYRIHLSDFPVLHFGKAGRNRFDDPIGLFGVCYLARSLEGAFAETCLRATGATLVAFSFLAERSVATITLTRPLRLVALHGPSLAAVGATSVVSAGPHDLAQGWSRALHDHGDAPDGIVYRANHDNGEHCIALFERGANAISVPESIALMDDRERLGSLLERYKIALG